MKTNWTFKSHPVLRTSPRTWPACLMGAVVVISVSCAAAQDTDSPKPAAAVAGQELSTTERELALDGPDLKELADELVMLAIDDELRRSEAVDGHRIDVDVDEGIVTLSGHVNNLLAKQIAVALAQRVRGAISVIDEMEVNTVERSDDELQQDVESALQADPATQHLSVDVVVQRGKVQLVGEAPSNGEKTLASDVAMGVRGVTEIENNLAVDTKHQLSDDELEHELSELYKYSAILDDSQIEVKAQKGTVVLNGRVASSFQKSYADLLAYRAGAERVDSRGIHVHWRHTNPLLRSKRYEKVTDMEIADAIKRAFKHDPRLLSFEPNVAVKHGIVTLTGDVGHLTAQRAAEEDARHTIGVHRVKNNLSVRWSDEPPSDEQIADYTRAAMSRDPYVERHNLNIECENAHVSLYGLVDTNFEKYHAEWIASRQKGVVHVNDYLAVRKKWKPKSDADIEADLKDKLAYTFVDPNNQVRATVKNGVAILSGTVDTWYMWQTALDLTIAAGAREPHNLIEVRYGLPSGPYYYGPHSYIPR